jgi:hypothetical protein
MTHLEDESHWPSPALLGVAVAAVDHPKLSRLFPFQAMASLCFSRTDWPHTKDCPCINVRRDGGRWTVLARPYGAEEPPPVLLDTDRIEDAVACVAANLPPGVETP